MPVPFLVPKKDITMLMATRRLCFRLSRTATVVAVGRLLFGLDATVVPLTMVGWYVGPRTRMIGGSMDSVAVSGWS